MGTNLQNEILANQYVGGVTPPRTFAAGVSLESVLDAILIGYISPTIAGIQMRLTGTPISAGPLDIGAQFSANQVYFTATQDSPNGNYPINCSFTSSGATIADVKVAIGTAASSQVVSLGGTKLYSRTTAGSINFVVNGARPDTGAQTLSISTSVAFAFRNYLVASATVITSDGTAQTVLDAGTVTSTLTTSKVWTPTCTSDNNDTTKYTYIIYPASYSDLSAVSQDGAQAVLGAFTKLGTFNINNSNGVPNSYLVYKSNAKGAFSSGVTLAIS